MTVALHYKRLVRNKPSGPRARMRTIEWCIHVLPFFVLLFSWFTSPRNCASHVKCQYTTTHLGKAAHPDGHRFRTSSAVQQTRERAYTDTSSLPRLPTRPRIKKCNLIFKHAHNLQRMRWGLTECGPPACQIPDGAELNSPVVVAKRAVLSGSDPVWDRGRI